MKRFVTVVFIGAVLAAGAAPAFASNSGAKFDEPEDAVRYRKAAYTLIGEHMGRIHGELQASRPDAQRIRASAEFIVLVGAAPWETFAPDTAKVKESKARPAIWQQRPEFERRAQSMQDQAARLMAVVKEGDAAALRAQFSALGKTCKACHDDFKQK
jgi:cytochrome c556